MRRIMKTFLVFSASHEKKQQDSSLSTLRLSLATSKSGRYLTDYEVRSKSNFVSNKFTLLWVLHRFV